MALVMFRPLDMPPMRISIMLFGILAFAESVDFNEAMMEIFPGSPYVKHGYMYVNEAPGLGVDINEKAAAKYPAHIKPGEWQVRKKMEL